MQYILDAHTHTIASGHAYNTMYEMINSASQKGLKLLGITEHAPAMPGTCTKMHFQNYKVVPREHNGLKLLLGTEANILDFNGTLDLDQDTLNSLDHVIASLHPPCITPGSRAENTHACIKAMENPKVSILGHPDDGRYPLDYDMIVKAAKDNGCLLEINNSSLNPRGFRLNSRENLMEMLKLCVKYDVNVIADSDAHVESDIGNFCYAASLLDEIKFPEELVVNHSLENFLSHIK